MDCVEDMIMQDYMRYQQTLHTIEEELQRLPRGNLVYRTSRGRHYCHLQYKDEQGCVHNQRVSDDELEDVQRLLIRRGNLKQAKRQLQFWIALFEKNLSRLHSDKTVSPTPKQSVSPDPEKPYLTLKGIFVRSKSEVIITNELYSNNISFEYEQPLLLDGYQRPFLPDFTICTPNKKQVVYWEHCGLMDNESYRSKWNWKKHVYESAGISEWHGNLIVTYESHESGFNLDEILQKIAWLRQL